MDKECSEPQKSIEIMWNDHLTGLTEESRVQMEKIAAENQNLSKLFEALRNQPNLNL